MSKSTRSHDDLDDLLATLPETYDAVRLHPDFRTPAGLNRFIDRVEDLLAIDLDSAEALARGAVKWSGRLSLSFADSDRFLSYSKAALVLGGVHRLKRRYEEALLSYSIAAEFLVARSRCDYTYMELFGRLSLLRRDQRRLVDAAKYCDQAISLARNISISETAQALVCMGSIQELSDSRSAEAAYSEALTILDRNDRFFFTANLGLAGVELDLGKLEIATERIAWLIKETVKSGAPPLSLRSLGVEWLQARLDLVGRPAEAEIRLIEIEKGYIRLGMPQYATIAKVDRAAALFGLGHVDVATSCCLDLLTELQAFGCPSEMIEAALLLKTCVEQRSLTASIVKNTRRTLERGL